MKIFVGTMDSPVGPLALAWRDGTVLAVHMQEAEDRRGWGARYADKSPEERLRETLDARFPEASVERAAGSPCVERLERYFEGDLGAIDGIAVDTGGTAFQSAVWEELRRIPAGVTRTYGDIAERAGRTGAARAAGGAAGSNPIPLIIPCHRVVGAGSGLTGFGGGLSRKRWLLQHEGALPAVLV